MLQCMIMELVHIKHSSEEMKISVSFKSSRNMISTLEVWELLYFFTVCSLLFFMGLPQHLHFQQFVHWVALLSGLFCGSLVLISLAFFLKSIHNLNSSYNWQFSCAGSHKILNFMQHLIHLQTRFDSLSSFVSSLVYSIPVLSFA